MPVADFDTIVDMADPDNKARRFMVEVPDAETRERLQRAALLRKMRFPDFMRELAIREEQSAAEDVAAQIRMPSGSRNTTIAGQVPGGVNPWPTGPDLPGVNEVDPADITPSGAMTGEGE